MGKTRDCARLNWHSSIATVYFFMFVEFYTAVIIIYKNNADFGQHGNKVYKFNEVADLFVIAAYAVFVLPLTLR